MTDISRLDQTIARDQTSQPLMWMVVSRALAGYSVRSGLTVTQRAAGANMSVDVAAGTYLLNNVPGTYAATTNVAVDAADGTNPRLDILYINSSGVLTIAKGTAAAISPPGETNYKKFEAPYPADLSGTAGVPLAIIHVGAGVSTITNANIWMIGSISELGYLEKLITDTVAKGAPRAQDTPDMTIYVAGFQAYINGALVSFAGGSTGTMTAPSANPRIDRVYLTDAGALAISTGAEDASPTAPALVANTVPICLVYHRVGSVHIDDADDGSNSYIYRDDRPFYQGVGSGGSGGGSVSVEVPYDDADEVIYDDTPGLKFDGSDDYVTCHADTDLSGDALTVAMTVTLFSLPTGSNDKFLFDNSLASVNDGSFAIRLNGSYSGAIQTTFIKAGAAMSQEWGVPSLNTPLKIIMTFDKVADEVYVYVDNIAGGAVWKPGLGSLKKYTVNLARRISTNMSYTNCIFHDLHVWKRVITSDERANYQDGAAISNTNLVISYAFDEESGATLDDASTEENDGTLINFADTTLGAGVVVGSGWVGPTNAKPLLTMPANGFVRFVGKVVTTAYDDGSVILGKEGDESCLMSAALVDAQGATNDTYTPNAYYASGSVIKAFITPGSATEGTFTLILEYVTI